MSLLESNLSASEVVQNPSAHMSALNNYPLIPEEIEVIQQMGVFHGRRKTSSRVKWLENSRAILTNDDRHAKRAVLKNLESPANERFMFVRRSMAHGGWHYPCAATTIHVTPNLSVTTP